MQGLRINSSSVVVISQQQSDLIVCLPLSPACQQTEYELMERRDKPKPLISQFQLSYSNNSLSSPVVCFLIQLDCKAMLPVTMVVKFEQHVIFWLKAPGLILCHKSTNLSLMLCLWIIYIYWRIRYAGQYLDLKEKLNHRSVNLPSPS